MSKKKMNKVTKFQFIISVCLLAIICCVLFSCTHKRDGELIKTQDGKIYRLEAASPHEAYFFRELNLSALDSLK